MTIFTFGDSWSADWQEWTPWPLVLKEKHNIMTTAFGVPGGSNEQLLELVSNTSIEFKDTQVSRCIVAFTSTNRITINMATNIELCVAADYYPDKWYKEAQAQVFNDVGLNDLLHTTKFKLHAMKRIIHDTWGCDTIFVPVFEDCEYWRNMNKDIIDVHDSSLINILHKHATGRSFTFDAPIYEVGFLQIVNEYGNKWAKKHLDSNYERAYFERTEFIDNKDYFDDTSHPTQLGHDVIADYFVKHLDIVDK